MEIGTNYSNSISSTSRVNKVVDYEKASDISYNDYSLSELRNIPYEEAKLNLESIRKRISELNETTTGEERDNYVATISQFAAVTMSDNNPANKAIYDLKQNMKNPLDTIDFDFDLQINMQDYYYGKDMHASFIKGNGTEELHVNKPLTKAQINSIDFNDFVSKMLKTFTEDIEKAPQSAKEQYQRLINTYNNLEINYKQAVREPYYA